MRRPTLHSPGRHRSPAAATAGRRSQRLGLAAAQGTDSTAAKQHASGQPRRGPRRMERGLGASTGGRWHQSTPCLQRSSCLVVNGRGKVRACEAPNLASKRGLVSCTFASGAKSRASAGRDGRGGRLSRWAPSGRPHGRGSRGEGRGMSRMEEGMSEARCGPTREQYPCSGDKGIQRVVAQVKTRRGQGGAAGELAGHPSWVRWPARQLAVPEASCWPPLPSCCYPHFSIGRSQCGQAAALHTTFCCGRTATTARQLKRLGGKEGHGSGRHSHYQPRGQYSLVGAAGFGTIKVADPGRLH